MFYVYLDWTLENLPRCFYVGRGTNDRIKKRDRNKFWKRIAAKYGWRREIVICTSIYEVVCSEEINFIRDMNTFYYTNKDGIACNFTLGGDGGLLGYKHSLETRKKIGLSRFGKKNSIDSIEKRKLRSLGNGNPMYGKFHKQESIERIRNSKLGKFHSQETINKISGANNHNYGKLYTAEHIQSISAENHFRTKLTWHIVNEIRQLWKLKIFSMSEIGKKFGILKAAVWKIVHYKTWKIS